MEPIPGVQAGLDRGLPERLGLGDGTQPRGAEVADDEMDLGTLTDVGEFSTNSSASRPNE